MVVTALATRLRSGSSVSAGDLRPQSRLEHEHSKHSSHPSAPFAKLPPGGALILRSVCSLVSVVTATRAPVTTPVSLASGEPTTRRDIFTHTHTHTLLAAVCVCYTHVCVALMFSPEEEVRRLLA